MELYRSHASFDETAVVVGHRVWPPPPVVVYFLLCGGSNRPCIVGLALLSCVASTKLVPVG